MLLFIHLICNCNSKHPKLKSILVVILNIRKSDPLRNKKNKTYSIVLLIIKGVEQNKQVFYFSDKFSPVLRLISMVTYPICFVVTDAFSVMDVPISLVKPILWDISRIYEE